MKTKVSVFLCLLLFPQFLRAAGDPSLYPGTTPPEVSPS